jgi:hypothetical protein
MEAGKSLDLDLDGNGNAAGVMLLKFLPKEHLFV